MTKRQELGRIEHNLAHAVTDMDRRMERAEIKAGRNVNIYRLGHYLGAVERIMKRIKRGEDMATVISDETNDRLRTRLLRAVDLPENGQ